MHAQSALVIWVIFVFSESCDLNPIEMVWNMLKRYISRKDPKTKDELVAACQEFWYEKLTPEVCRRFIDHNYKVVPLTVSIGGNASGDLPKQLSLTLSDILHCRFKRISSTDLPVSTC